MRARETETKTKTTKTKKTPRRRKDDDDSVDSPSAWFVTLESAIRRGERALEAECHRQLARLGVRVDVDFRCIPRWVGMGGAA